MAVKSAAPRPRQPSGDARSGSGARPAGPPRRVLLADDHQGVRVGTRLALEEGGFDVCAEAYDGPSAVEAARRERPDICLIDVLMPGGGIEAAAQISAELPDVAIVILTVSDDEEHLFDAIRAGASGYLLKDMDPDRLAAALSGVLAGEAAFPRRLVARVVEEFSERQRRRVPLPAGGRAELTAREWETLELLRAGNSTSAVARRLGISDVTVRRHVSVAVSKLRVRDRRAALELLHEVHAEQGRRARA
jgi:DNA-binding NarL/FixJ family response regulator